jgi:glucose/arabinose dehydrogenase
MKRSLLLGLLVSIAGCNGPTEAADTGTPGIDGSVDAGRDAFVAPDTFVPTDGGDGCELTTYPTLALEQMPGTFHNPLGVVAVPGSTDLAIVEHSGRVQIMREDGSNGPEFLDLTDLAGGASGGNEQGLLGLAFHPDYATNGLFYVYYAPVGGDTNVLAMGHRSSTDPETADPTTTPILTLNDDFASNHNGGSLAFGSDGLLYVGTGDGGQGGDPMMNGQDTNTLYAKILRIRVGPGIATYESPSTNPFASGGGLPEIYAYGLRNPWRFSFDRWSHALFIGDVGQDTYEEIDVDTDGMGGDNYGWNTCEATHDYGGNDCSALADHHAPIFEYPHSGGLFGLGGAASVAGGVVYRGRAIPALYGTYLFAEEVGSQIAGFRYCDGTARNPHVFDELGNCENPASFGENAAGEIYVACVDVAGDGAVMRLTTP